MPVLQYESALLGAATSPFSPECISLRYQLHLSRLCTVHTNGISRYQLVMHFVLPTVGVHEITSCRQPMAHCVHYKSIDKTIDLFCSICDGQHATCIKHSGVAKLVNKRMRPSLIRLSPSRCRREIKKGNCNSQAVQISPVPSH